MMINNLESPVQEMIDLFPQTKKEKRKPSHVQKQRWLKRKLNEVILGKRSYIKVYSQILQKNFWFVNEGLIDPTDSMFTGNVITMEMLAEIMMTNQSASEIIEKSFGSEVKS
jgi:hypothetical protein